MREERLRASGCGGEDGEPEVMWGGEGREGGEEVVSESGGGGRRVSESSVEYDWERLRAGGLGEGHGGM